MVAHTKTRLVLALFAVATYAHPRGVNARAAKKFRYAAIGDSYASGVSYSKSSEWDGNKDDCHRLQQAYSVQLKDDWPDGLDRPQFAFPACSGARLEHMVLVGQKDGLKPQMDQLDQDTRLITLQAGGNDAGFYGIAQDCIYHNDQGKSYGQPYPGNGACTDTIARVEEYIDRPDSEDRGAFRDIDTTIVDIVNHDNAKVDGFKLYFLGYAHFFSVDSPDSDWCNDSTFTVNTKELNFLRPDFQSPKLTNELRGKINELTTRLNDKIQEVIRARNDPKVVYISITEAISGHRFCEPGSSWWGDHSPGGNVWFWNAWVSTRTDSDEYDGAPIYVDHQNGAVKAFAKAYNGTSSAQDSVDAMESFDWSDLLHLDKDGDVTPPYKGADSGSTLRPFHPKEPGHRAIKDVIKARLTTDFS